jgi:hypothetical protein
MNCLATCVVSSVGSRLKRDRMVSHEDKERQEKKKRRDPSHFPFSRHKILSPRKLHKGVVVFMVSTVFLIYFGNFEWALVLKEMQ